MSTERQIVEKFKEALETKNIDVFAPYVAEDATVEVFPSTVGGKKTGAQWISTVGERSKAAQSSKFEIVNVIEHPLFILFQANASVTFPSGPFAQEMLGIFQFTKDASGALKVTNVIQYVDSFKVAEIKAKMGV